MLIFGGACTTLLLCFLVTLLLWSLVTLCYLGVLLPCYSVSLLLLLPCYSVSLLLCHLVALFPCYSVSLFPCYLVTLLPVNRVSTVAKAVGSLANFDEDMTVAVVTACWNLTNWSAPSDRELSIAPLHILNVTWAVQYTVVQNEGICCMVTRTGSCSRQLVCILLCHPPLHHHPSAK